VNHSSRLGTALHVTYALLVVLVAWGAHYAWYLRCEGFGCIGLGIVWASWLGVLFSPTLLLGLFLALSSGVRSGLAQATRWLFSFQVALGLALAAVWLAKRFN
jgi:hypothetical protein